MRNRARFALVILVSSLAYFGWTTLAHAGIVGPSPEDFSNGIDSFMQHHAWHWVCALFRLIADFFMNCLFKVYQFLGTRVLYIPDIASPRAWMGLGDPAAPQSVSNVIKIMVSVGWIVALIASSIYLGQIGFGSAKHQLTKAVFLRAILPVVAIAVWPFWTSETCRASSNLSIYIYHQNSFQTTGAFATLSNFDVTTENGGSTSYAEDHRINFYYEMNLGKMFAWSFATFLCFLGLVVGWAKSGSGDSNGYKYLIVGGLCFIGIMLLPTFYSQMTYSGGVGNLAQHSSEGPIFSTFGVLPQNPSGQLNMPVESHPTTKTVLANDATTPVNPNPDPVKYPNDTWDNIITSGIKAFVSIFGILICLAVLIAKGYQVVMLVLFFFLLFAFFGCFGHPDWEDLTYSGIWSYVKLLFQNVIWGVGFFLLNLIPHLNWSPAGQAAGQGTIMSAFGILSVLMVIQNSKDIADIFTKTKSHFEGSAGQIFRDVTRVLRTALPAANVASRLVEASTGKVGQKIAAGVGGGAGAGIGALGGLLMGNPAAGAMLGMKYGSAVGEHGTKAMNTVSKTLGKATSGKPFSGGPGFPSIRTPKQPGGNQGGSGRGGAGSGKAPLNNPKVNAMRFGSRNTASASQSSGGRRSAQGGPKPSNTNRPTFGGPKPPFKA